MGVKTLGGWHSDIRKALGRPTLDVTDITDWVNNAMYEFGYAFKFPELQATGTLVTVAGQDAYALPSAVRALSDEGVVITAPSTRWSGPLQAETRTMYRRSLRYDTIGNRGTPKFYHTHQRKLFLRPRPDSTIMTIEYDYWKKITPLSVTSDVSPFGEDWDEVIFRGALLRGHLAFGEHDRLVNVYNLYLGSIRSRIMSEDLEEYPEGGISLIQSQYDSMVR